jgi:hypothetical protein
VILCRSRIPELTLIAERCCWSACSPEARDGSGNRESVDSLAQIVRIVGCGINTCALRSDDTPERVRDTGMSE